MHTPQANRYNLKQVTFVAAASYTQCVPVDGHACFSIHKLIETYVSKTHSARSLISGKNERKRVCKVFIK